MLEHFYFRNEFESRGVFSLEFLVPVGVHGVFEFFRKCFDFSAFLKKFFFEQKDLFFEFFNFTGLFVGYCDFAVEVSYFELEQSDVAYTFLVHHFSFGKCVLLDFDFFVQQSEFVVLSDELGAEKVAHVDDSFVVLFLGFAFVVSLDDDFFEFGGFVDEVHFLVLQLSNYFFLLFFVELSCFVLPRDFFSYFLVFSEFLFLLFAFFFVLFDLVFVDFVVPFEFGYFVLAFN
mmetsp:Transcript_4371/g.6587  ORF Transcript_4371/g.6587 Transcript_4371/m.6587 type:complete len:231 (-) Transcript_4371:1515-2207(-)